MEILHDKPKTKRPAIVEAATSLFAERGIDATSIRDIADAAGVREASIYRHFESKDDMALKIFASWYGWYSHQLEEIVAGSSSTKAKLHKVVRLELTAAANHSAAYAYFCENEARFVSSLPSDVPRARHVLMKLIREGQQRGEVKEGAVGVITDMLSGALCGVTLSWIRCRRPGKLGRHIALIADTCWNMIAA
jgi:AcrR family transcriptional regulator